ncbi:MAG: hypothetical protein M5U34_29240 [Chloroflexi bacterium]|nr:hypothetical protein [Chloroflexota bacterium]
MPEFNKLECSGLAEKRPFPLPRTGQNNLVWLASAIWNIAVWLRNGRFPSPMLVKTI